MGYYTYFTLETKNKINLVEFIKFCLKERKENDHNFMYPFDFTEFLIESFDYANEKICLDIETDKRVKWYDYVDDMKKLSQNFPDVIFKLHGEGEDRMDMWIHYFCNGKSYKEMIIQIVEKDFDENKLKF